MPKKNSSSSSRLVNLFMYYREEKYINLMREYEELKYRCLVLEKKVKDIELYTPCEIYIQKKQEESIKNSFTLEIKEKKIELSEDFLWNLSVAVEENEKKIISEICFFIENTKILNVTFSLKDYKLLDGKNIKTIPLGIYKKNDGFQWGELVLTKMDDDIIVSENERCITLKDMLLYKSFILEKKNYFINNITINSNNNIIIDTVLF